MPKKYLVTLLTALFSVIPVQASELTDIITKAKSNYERFWQDVKDMRIVQSAKAFEIEGKPAGLAGSGAVTYRKNKKTRVGEINAKRVDIIIGDKKWILTPYYGKQTESQDTRAIDMDKTWYNSLTEDAKITGKEMLDGRNCYVIKSKTKDGNAGTYWVEDKSLNLVRVEVIESDSSSTRIIHSDFRKVLGAWEIPFKQDIYGDLGLISGSTITEIKVNQGLSDDLFDPNKVLTVEMKYDKNNPEPTPTVEQNEFLKQLQEQWKMIQAEQEKMNK